jgi:hypothetical protein
MMPSSPLEGFAEKVRDDEELLARIIAAEEAVEAETERAVDLITALAKDAGYDIEGWATRPAGGVLVATAQEGGLKTQCNSTCCWATTSSFC